MTKKKTTRPTSDASFATDEFFEALLRSSPEEQQALFQRFGFSPAESAEMLAKMELIQKAVSHYDIDVEKLVHDANQTTNGKKTDNVTDDLDNEDGEDDDDSSSGKFFACVLFKETKPNLDALKERLRARQFVVPDREELAEHGLVTDQDELVIATGEESTSALIVRAEQLPDFIAQGTAEFSLLCDNAEAIIKAHRSMLEVCLTTSDKDPLRYANAFLDMVCAALEDEAALGVCQNMTILSKDDFLSMVQTVIDTQVFDPRLLISVCPMMHAEEGQPVLTLYTEGCGCFDLPDFEVRYLSADEMDTWTSALYQIAGQCILNRKAPADGEVIADVPGFPCRVSLTTALFDEDRSILLLSPLNDAEHA